MLSSNKGILNGIVSVFDHLTPPGAMDKQGRNVWL